jgi:hypothetical protein
MLVHLNVHPSTPYMTRCYSHSMGLAVVGVSNLKFGKIVKNITCLCTPNVDQHIPLLWFATASSFGNQKSCTKIPTLKWRLWSAINQHKYTLNDHKHNCRTTYWWFFNLHVRIGKYNNENIINTKIPSSSSITYCVHVTPKDIILRQ